MHSVCYETGDVGAFYIWAVTGRRAGRLSVHNFFHHIKGPGLHGAMAVYLDDAASGITVYGNVFYRAGRARSWGRTGQSVENNIFVECQPSVHVDARGLNWMRDHVEGNGTLPTRLKEVPYQDSVWRTRYPKLVDVLQDEPGAPKGNLVTRNVSQGGKWLEIEKVAEPLVKFEDNLIDQDPHFVNAPNLNFQLRGNSPVWKLGFKRIPIQKIGLYKDELRASWPVEREIRKD